MSESPGANVHPILQIYRLYGLLAKTPDRDLAVEDGRHSLGLEARLARLGSVARKLVHGLVARAAPVETCQLRLDDCPVVDFMDGPAQDWFDWQSIADLAGEGLLDHASAKILGGWKRRFEIYRDSGVWPTEGRAEHDCLAVLEQLAAHDHGRQRFTLDLILPKRALIEDFLLAALPVPAGEVSAFLWYDLGSMSEAYADFEEFLQDAGGDRPVVVFVHQPAPTYSGDYFKVLPLAGLLDAPSDSALAAELDAFEPGVFARYRELRRRHWVEPRPRGRLDLPQTLPLRRGDRCEVPGHPFFEAGPWRSWLACAVLSWLAGSIETRGGVTLFVLPGNRRVALRMALDDVTGAGESIFGAADWRDEAALLARHVEHAAGSDRLRAMWAHVLAETPAEAFAPPALWQTLGAACRRFYGLMALRDVTSESFVLLRAEVPAAESRELVECLEASHVIVTRNEPREEHFLFSRPRALSLLSRAAEGTLRTQEAFRLERSEPPPALDAETPAAAAPDRCIVTEAGQLLGFRAGVLPEAGLRETRDRLRRAETRGPAPPIAKSAADFPRTLLAELPDQIPIGKPVQLSVSLTEDPAGMPLALPLGAEVDVIVQPRHGLDLQGPGEGRLASSRAAIRPLAFELRAIAEGPAEVAVMAFHEGQRLGDLTLKPKAVGVGSIDEPVRHSQPLRPITVDSPDLSLTILEDGQPAFTLVLSARDPSHGLNFSRFGPVRLERDAQKYFERFFADVERLPCRTPAEKEEVRNELANRGASLFDELLPEDLREKLWQIYPSIRSVRVQSEEPWIPWELLKLQGKKDGIFQEGPFFCEAFAVTRWRVGMGLRPVLSLGKMAVVVPGDSNLPYAHDERDYLLSLAGGGREVVEIPAKSVDLKAAFASAQYDGWHFTGHGASRADPNRSVIRLEGQDRLTPHDLNGKVKNLGYPHPLVFLNACQIGRTAMSLTGIGGWAQRFLDVGAAAFIGAYWNVHDESAYNFTRALYSRLFRGVAIGQAVREAREEIRSSGDPTWLAYTVFADPSAVVR